VEERMKLKMWKRPSDYEGKNYMGYFEGIECRMASLDFNHGSFAEISNFEVILKALGGEDGKNVVVMEFDDVVGWRKKILVHESCPKLLETLQELMEKMNEYPLLDEKHYDCLIEDAVKKEYHPVKRIFRDKAVQRLIKSFTRQS
jgi:hypothetical protein